MDQIQVAKNASVQSIDYCANINAAVFVVMVVELFFFTR